MKRTFLTLFLWGVASTGAWSCDICGCSSMGMGMSDWGFSDRSAVGLRYAFRSFEADGLRDYFYQSELRAAIRLNPKFQLRVQVPVLFAQRKVEGLARPAEINGLGDASILLAYQLWSKIYSSSTHQIRVAAGLNLPTGNFENRPVESLIAPNFQAGTGSWDPLFQGQYQLNHRNWIFLAQFSWLWNQSNSYGYRFGNQYQTMLSAGYIQELESSKLIWLAGLDYEDLRTDINQRGFYQSGTGGQAYFARFGAQWFVGDWWFAVFGQRRVGLGTQQDYRPLESVNVSMNYLF